MLFDAIGLCLAALFIGLGAWRGSFAGFLRLATVVCAYLAGYFAATTFGHVLALLAGMPRIVASVLLGSGAFTLVYLACSIGSSLLIRHERERRDDVPRGSYDRLGGACFGVIQAAVALLLLAVLGSVLDAAYRAGLPQGVDQSGSYLIAATRKVAATGVGAALGDGPGAQLAVKLVADPGKALVSLQQLLASPRFAKLQQDALFWDMACNGEAQIDAALNRRSFLELMYDDAMRGQLADLGLVPEAARNDPQAFREYMRSSLAQIGPRIRVIRGDPALAQLAQDPDVKNAIEAGDGVALLSHPDFRALVNRVIRDYESGGPPTSN